MQKKALILGIGNILLKDEGIGVRIVEYLNSFYEVPKGVDLLDGGTAGLGLLSAIKDYKKIIIIDAVDSGRPPGTVLSINAKDIPERFTRATAHSIGVRELLRLSEFEGHRPEVFLIGIEPKDISRGMELSPVVKKAIPEIALAVKSGLEKWGIELKEKK